MKDTPIKQLYPNSIVQEISAPNYEIELNFTGNNKEQSRFLNQHENVLKQDQTITFIFDNELLPFANMVLITHVNNAIEYQVSLVLSRRRWKEIDPLYKFVPKLISRCKEQGHLLELEDEDDHFCYLLLTKRVKATMTLESRINEISLLLLKKINETL